MQGLREPTLIGLAVALAVLVISMATPPWSDAVAAGAGAWLTVYIWRSASNGG